MAAREIFDDLGLVLRLNQHIQQVSAAPVAAAGAAQSPRNAQAAALPRQSSFKVLASLEAVSTRDQRERAQFDHQRDVFASTDTSRLPFHLQGDRELNEGEALSRRRALRFSGALRDKIAFLWDVARGGKQATAFTSGAAAASSEEMNEQDYVALMLLIFKVLRDDFTLELARKQIHCDWDVDSRHGQALTFDQFFSAIFELVDMWTCDVEEVTYVRFVELLLHRVTVRVVVFLDDNTLKLAMSDNFDEAVVVKAIPLSTISRFASVARIVAPRGVRTIGELASADPAMVEQERVDYLRRTSVTPNYKIGSELQELLAMFRKLAQTFGHADYDLEGNHVLRRRPSMLANAAGGIQSLADNTMSNYAVQKQENVCGARGRGPADINLGQTTTFETITGLQPSGSVLSGPAWGLASPANAAVDQIVPVSGGRKRLNSIHDISQADPDLVTALKTSFLIEKRISLERQTEISAIREELAKFGVEGSRDKDEEAARKQYDTLYEMFVVRDGDDLKALAHAMLQQIKAELVSHGITVDDDADAEDAYDHFYDAVVTGTGETIVADAQQWVQHTLTTGTVGAYVKMDYHELKPVDDVALIGTLSEDDEFVSLVAKDEVDEYESAQVNRGNRRKSSSPIQRKPSQLGKSFRQQLGGDMQPATPAASENSSVTPAVARKMEKSKSKHHEGGHNADDTQDIESAEDENTRKRSKAKRGMHKTKKEKKTGGDADETPDHSHSEESDENNEATTLNQKAQNGKVESSDLENDTIALDEETDTRDEEKQIQNFKSVRRKTTRKGDIKATSPDYSDAKNESSKRNKQRRRSSTTSNCVEVNSSESGSDAERERRRAEGITMSSRSGPLDADSGLGDTSGHHMNSEDQNRGPQGVEFGFEDDVPEPVELEQKSELVW